MTSTSIPCAKALRLAIIDDDEVIARQTSQLLLREDCVGHVSVYSSGRDFLGSRARCPQDVILLDMEMPGMDGVQVMEALRAAGDHTPVIVLTAFERQERLREALALGACGFLTKGCDVSEMLAGLCGALRGERVLSERPLQVLVDSYLMDPAPPAQVDSTFVAAVEAMPPRLCRVAEGIAQGMTNKQIAAHLGLRVSSVRTYSHEVQVRLGCTSRTDLAVRFARCHLTSEQPGTPEY